MARTRKEKEYEVERIVMARVCYKKGRRIHWQFRVKWKGYADKDNTWEPEESFEESQNLIEKFWSKVDLGGRNPKKARDFSVKEEVTPRDETWSDLDAEGEDDEENKEEGGKDSAPPKARGKKRPSGAVTETTPKRKRGRPSKADTEAEAQEEKAADGDEDGDSDSRRNSRRLSEKELNRAELVAKRKRMMLGSSSEESMSEGVTSEESESSDIIIIKKAPRQQAIKKTPKQETTKKSPMKMRKRYIESDEEDDTKNRDVEESSHDGSLFSGEDSDEEGQAKTAGGADLKSAKPEPPPESKQTDKKRPVKQAKRGIVLIDDPSIGKALEERVLSRAEKQAIISGRAPTVGSSASAHIQSMPFPNPARKDRAIYKPTLLTFEKGKLISHRSNIPTPSWEPPTSSVPIASEPAAAISDIPGSPTVFPEDTSWDVDTLEDVTTDAVSRDPDAMDTTEDFDPSAIIVGTTTVAPEEVIPENPIPAGPPPTADELLRLSGASNAANDLPDFPTSEDVPETDAVSGTPVTTAIIPETSSSAGPSAAAEIPAWRQSSIFSFPTPKSILQKVLSGSLNDPPPPTRPPKLVVPLRLGPSTVVSVALKDMVAATVGLKMTELLKTDRLDGATGKLFPDAVLSCVEPAGSCARIVPDDDSSEEQRTWFSKFSDELQKGGLFVVVIGGHNFILCSSTNHSAGVHLQISQNLGLSRTVLMQHTPICDSVKYAECAMKAQDLILD